MSSMFNGYVGGVRITPDVDPTTEQITSITIELNTSEDTGPGSDLYRLVCDDGGLAGLLAAVIAPDRPTHQRDDLTATLNGLATTRDLVTTRIPHLATLARDRSAWSWRRIAGALGLAHRTVERQVTATRRELADQGIWIDAHGLHHGTATVARALAHHRETAGAAWPDPVEITVPDQLTPGQTATATVRHRRADGTTPTTHLELTGRDR